MIPQIFITFATVLSVNVFDNDGSNFVPQEIHLYIIFSSSDNI